MLRHCGTVPSLITVVVPAHNVGRYLAPCLDSVLAQSCWADCRVLVVDDGSADHTGAVADGYATRSPQITVLHQDNAGPGAGAARNRGLDLVETEFVLFLDGDDELAPGALERLRAPLLSGDLDLAVGATEQFPEPRTWLWSGYFSTGESRPVAIEDVPLLAHDARTCNKLYRTSWLRSLGLRFAEGIHHQDTVVNVPAMLLASRFALVGDVVHRYRKRAEGDSVMDSHFTRQANYFDHLQVIEELNALRPSLPATREALLQAFIARSFQGFSWRAPRVLPAEQLPEFYERAQPVIRTLNPSVIIAATRDASERAGYFTMFTDDYDSFTRLDELSRTIVARDGQLYLGLPADERYGELVRLSATRALATDLSADGSGVGLKLRLRIRGTRQPGELLTRTSVQGLVDTEVAFTAPVEWTGADGTESLGEVRIGWPKLDAGSYELRLRMETETGIAERWLRRPADADQRWLPDETLADRLARLSLAAGEEGRAVLGVEPTARLRWSRRLQRLQNR